jgi:hypothetical protein
MRSKAEATLSNAKRLPDFQEFSASFFLSDDYSQGR